MSARLSIRSLPASVFFSLLIALVITAMGGTPKRVFAQAPALLASPSTETPGTDSCKVPLTTFPGAKDYRLRVSNPDGSLGDNVKYAGLAHLMGGWGGNTPAFVRDGSLNLVWPLSVTASPVSLPPSILPIDGTPYYTISSAPNEIVSVPNSEIEWNGMVPGQSVTLVEEAVDAVGPCPPGSLYSGVDNSPLISCIDGMCIEGSDHGTTLDGLNSTNGQGASTNVPNVIARSAPFVVTCLGGELLAPAKTTVIANFSSATISGPVNVDPAAGNEQYNVTDVSDSSPPQTSKWQVLVNAADTDHSSVFVMNNHIMDVLFDGGTPNKSSNPIHNNHASLAYTPTKTAALGPGHIVHVVMEVDAHTDGRRWMSIVVGPANDPLTNFYSENRVNASNSALFFEIVGSSANVVQQTGPATGTASTSTTHSYNRPWILGDAFTPGFFDYARNANPSAVPNTQYFQQFGRGLDDRSRFDLFVSQTRAQGYEDGALIFDQPLDQTLTFSHCKIYFAHYVYHTTNEVTDNKDDAPYELDWINNVPYSDERHWNNMGYEVLPNTQSEWALLGGLAQPHGAVPITSVLGQ